MAGYDSRLTPDMDEFLKRTKGLIKQTYYQNKNTPVHLVSHSNGPFYAHYAGMEEQVHSRLYPHCWKLARAGFALPSVFHWTECH
ncbi:hypothetical protein [Nostoc sp.]|uniref:hypothetical protein n=1 Tax=Nostoc sp. TaxID=1180 RepID=UPI003FA5D0FE